MLAAIRKFIRNSIRWNSDLLSGRTKFDHLGVDSTP